jgi:hypothetical protein
MVSPSALVPVANDGDPIETVLIANEAFDPSWINDKKYHSLRFGLHASDETDPLEPPVPRQNTHFPVDAL